MLIFHSGARWVGLGWLLSGLTLYVAYRKTQGKPLLKRVTIPERALRQEAPDAGVRVDPGADLRHPARRRHRPDGRAGWPGETHDDVDEEGAVIEAIWVFEMPLSLPARRAAARGPGPACPRGAQAGAKAVGEEYEGVEVATATVRARRAGQAIVSEAKRRGVEAIVLGAEEPSRVRGGALLGGVEPARRTTSGRSPST